MTGRGHSVQSTYILTDIYIHVRSAGGRHSATQTQHPLVLTAEPAARFHFNPSCVNAPQQTCGHQGRSALKSLDL